VRRNGLLIVVAASLATAVGVLAFLAQRPPTETAPPYAVAKVAEVTGTPRTVSVVMWRGAERMMQRERSDFGRCPGSLGCPGLTALGPTPVFLVRDEGGALHAFIGADPRNGCALQWYAIPPDQNWSIDGVRVEAVFRDPCHGSMYDRTGQVIAGPSPWDLNQLATEVRGGDLYVDPGKIVVGRCRLCPGR
jgi:Rieske Fe-S protein